MKLSTLCYCLTDERILLALKKKGFGEGKWNGMGGKVEAGETVVQAAVRELEEEVGLMAQDKDLQLVAVIKFFMAGECVSECQVFFVRVWTGEPIESEEMKPQWYSIDKLPFDGMWPGDRVWLPLLLAGKKIQGEEYLDASGQILEKFEWKELSSRNNFSR
ncbi:8-oxo-dGTP diphosphatase [Candidatus Uhrbacteria bacterium]|nr:8-oxo-dGTP diphosphatase [Candidatus Uhrbacteria bacterium]